MLDHPSVIQRHMKYDCKQKNLIFNKLTENQFVSHVRNQLPGFIDIFYFFDAEFYFPA